MFEQFREVQLSMEKSSKRHTKKCKKRFLFISIHDGLFGTTATHWSLLICDIENKQYFSIDSMCTEDQHSQFSSTLSRIDKVISQLQQFLFMANFSYIARVPVQQVQTLNDCGPFILMYMNKFVESESTSTNLFEILSKVSNCVVYNALEMRKQILSQIVTTHPDEDHPDEYRQYVCTHAQCILNEFYSDEIVSPVNQPVQCQSESLTPETMVDDSSYKETVSKLTYQNFLKSLPGNLSNRKKKRLLKLKMIEQALEEAEELFQESYHNFSRPELTDLPEINLPTPKINVAACEKPDTTEATEATETVESSDTTETTTATGNRKTTVAKRKTTKPKASGVSNATKSLKPPKKQMIEFLKHPQLPNNSNHCSILSFDIETREVDQIPAETVTQELDDQRKNENESLKMKSDAEKEVWIQNQQVFMISGVFGHFIKDQFYLQDNFVATLELTHESDVELPPDCRNLRFFENEKQLLEFFVNYLNDKNPSVLTGFNITDFDNVVLGNRIVTLGVDFPEPMLDEITKSHLSSLWQNVCSEWAGRIVCDSYVYAKQFIVSKCSKSLRSLSWFLLNESKGRLHDEFHHLLPIDCVVERPQEVLNYCFKDSVIALKLFLLFQSNKIVRPTFVTHKTTLKSIVKHFGLTTSYI
ncbi:hypothetical protein GEMRC1_003283 [Eukaryota sp. GEM-RC1]